MYHLDKTTTAMTTNNHQTKDLLRGAIALNNAAISMLEKGYPTKALRIFRTVLSLLQESTKRPISFQTLQQELCQAAAQVACTKKKHHVFCEVHVVDDDDESAKYEATIYGPSSSVGFALRLGDLYTEGCTISAFQYSTAAILCNFALAYRFGFVATKRANLLVGAQQTLRTAKFLLVGSAKMTDELYELYRWHLMLTMLRQTMIQVSRDLILLPGHAVPASVSTSLKNMAWQDLDEFESLVGPDEAEYIERVYRLHKTSAAAAA